MGVASTASSVDPPPEPIDQILQGITTRASVVPVDPNGDIILQCYGPGIETHLRVSSNVLSLASAVFGEILESRFRDFPRGTWDVPSPIPLVGDDPEALTLLCNTIHFRTNEVPENLSPTCLENLAIICDKYKCVSAIRIHAAAWMKQLPTGTRDLHRLLVVAYALNMPESFSTISWEILKARIGPFCDLEGVAGHDLVKHNLLIEFRIRQAECALDVQNAMLYPISEMMSSSCRYTHNVPRYLKSLAKLGLWPLHEIFEQKSLVQIIQKINEVPDRLSDSCRNGACCCVDLRRKMEKRISQSKKGLCLDCILTQGKSLRESMCRVPHRAEGSEVPEPPRKNSNSHRPLEMQPVKFALDR